MSYLSPDEVAERLGITAKTVREWLKSSEMVGIKLGGSWKIHEKDFERFVDGQRLDALLRRAKKVHSDTDWFTGQCSACGDHIPIPSQKGNWVCSASCKKKHDNDWALIVGENTDDRVFNQGTVIPHF